MGYEDFWDALAGSFFTIESWIKVIFLLVTMPLWGPILKAMWSEVNQALAPEGGLLGRKDPEAVRPRPPGLDPFLNLPRAGHRSLRPRGPTTPGNARSDGAAGDRDGAGVIRPSSARPTGGRSRPVHRSGF